MKKLLLFLAALLLAATLIYAGGTKEPATKRPVWLWMGVANPGNEYSEASLAKANEWALKKFGATFKISTAPPGSTFVQALNLLTAQNQLPDVIGSVWDSSEAVQKVFSDLAAQGKLLQLDKYFNDPKSFPIFAAVGKSVLRPMMYQGKQYAFPGWNIRRNDKQDPYWGSYYWNIRLDVSEKYGVPTTFAELYDLLKKVKADAIQDVKGQPTIPMIIAPRANMSQVLNFLSTNNGAGWEVDAQKRLMPFWAGQEWGANLKWLNTFWREGLMDPGQFLMDETKFQEQLNMARYAVSSGPSYLVSVFRDQAVGALADKIGNDAPEVKKLLPFQYVMMVHPTADNPGRITNAVPGYVMISAQNPNPDATMKLLEWYLSDEGIISGYGSAGELGVDWEWADPPWNWNLKGKPQNQAGTDPSGFWRDAKKAEADPPKMLPLIGYFHFPTYSSIYDKLFYGGIPKLLARGLKVGSKPGEPTVREVSAVFNSEVGKLSSPVPSYAQVIADIPPLEASAMATVTQRLQEGLAKVITAPTEADYDAEYKSFIKSLIDVTAWKPIYEAKQKRWTDWLASNKIDDRSDLKAVTPIAEWKAVMGW